MLKSFYCWTHDIAAEQLPDVGECSYDQGGYFIINGSEKVRLKDWRLASRICGFLGYRLRLRRFLLILLITDSAELGFFSATLLIYYLC